MPFKNLPTEEAKPLSDLIEARQGQVSSMSLTKIGDPVAGTLLAFSEGESVSEERYPGDTLYYLVEGETDITFADKQTAMQTGDVLMVPAQVEHAVEPKTEIKLLQISFT